MKRLQKFSAILRYPQKAVKTLVYTLRNKRLDKEKELLTEKITTDPQNSEQRDLINVRNLATIMLREVKGKRLRKSSNAAGMMHMRVGNC